MLIEGKIESRQYTDPSTGAEKTYYEISLRRPGNDLLSCQENMQNVSQRPVYPKVDMMVYHLKLFLLLRRVDDLQDSLPLPEQLDEYLTNSKMRHAE